MPIAYIQRVFKHANERVVHRLDQMPTTHEEWLDFAFIESVAAARGPRMTSSGTLVDIDVHFVGGGWHWKRWEVADIGFIVNFRRGDRVLRTKVVLLQSKRLYPRESEFTEDQGVSHSGGFGSLMHASLPATLGSRAFRFDESCRYKALQVGDDQWKSIAHYEKEYGLPVHYMLYHPSVMPKEVHIPVRVPIKISRKPITVGTRVISGRQVRELTSSFARNYAPAYSELRDPSGNVGATLPDFVVAGVLACTEGYVVDDGVENEGLQRVFNQRSAPIAAAIRLDITLPE